VKLVLRPPRTRGARNPRPRASGKRSAAAPTRGLYLSPGEAPEPGSDE